MFMRCLRGKKSPPRERIHSGRYHKSNTFLFGVSRVRFTQANKNQIIRLNKCYETSAANGLPKSQLIFC